MNVFLHYMRCVIGDQSHGIWHQDHRVRVYDPDFFPRKITKKTGIEIMKKRKAPLAKEYIDWETQSI